MGTIFHSKMCGEVGASDFTARADYKMELELTKSGVVESTENYDLKIEESGST